MDFVLVSLFFPKNCVFEGGGETGVHVDSELPGKLVRSVAASKQPLNLMNL